MTRDIKISMLILLLFVSSCIPGQPKSVDALGYVHYVEQEANGLKGTVHSGEWSYRFQYKPSSYIALREMERIKNPDSATVAKRAAGFSRTVWFNVAINAGNETADPLKYRVRDLNEYNSRLAYFLSQAAGNFHLTYGKKGEMKQIGYYFENNYSIKPEVVAVVGFEIPDMEPKEAVTLEYEDGLFNAGILRFRVFPESIARIPRLTIKSS